MTFENSADSNPNFSEFFEQFLNKIAYFQVLGIQNNPTLKIKLNDNSQLELTNVSFFEKPLGFNEFFNPVVKGLGTGMIVFGVTENSEYLLQGKDNRVFIYIKEESQMGRFLETALSIDDLINLYYIH